MRRCVKCSKEIKPRPGPGRPPTKCDDCRKPSRRPAAKPAAPVVTALPPREPSESTGTLTAGVRAVLHDVGRENTAAGLAAVHAAMVLDQGGHTAAGAASLLKEMRAAVEEATKNASAGDDLVDELRAKRQARLSG